MSKTVVKKYELKDSHETLECGTKLKYIKRLSDGELGGYVESEDNLSQDGDCWISNRAVVYGNARVSGNARIRGEAHVYGNAEVCGNALVGGGARISGDARVFDNGQVYGASKVYGKAIVCDNGHVLGVYSARGRRIDGDTFAYKPYTGPERDATFEENRQRHASAIIFNIEDREYCMELTGEVTSTGVKISVKKEIVNRAYNNTDRKKDGFYKLIGEYGESNYSNVVHSSSFFEWIDWLERRPATVNLKKKYKKKDIYSAFFNEMDRKEAKENAWMYDSVGRIKFDPLILDGQSWCFPVGRIYCLCGNEKLASLKLVEVLRERMLKNFTDVQGLVEKLKNGISEMDKIEEGFVSWPYDEVFKEDEMGPYEKLFNNYFDPLNIR